MLHNIAKTLMRIGTIWRMLALLSLEESLSNIFTSLLFILGKFARFGIFLGFLLTVSSTLKAAYGLSEHQLILYFVSFNLFDLFGQLLFRGVYMFKGEILSGTFDFVLIKPFPSLLYILLRRFDVLDLPLLVVNAILFGWLVGKQSLTTFLFLGLALMIALSLLIALHVTIAAFYLIFESVNFLTQIYRQLTTMMRFPSRLYHPQVQYLLKFIVPLYFVFQLPSEVVWLAFSTTFWGLAIFLSIGWLWASLFIWQVGLKRYSSASS